MTGDVLAAAEAFIREHHIWAGVIVGVLCFLESLVFISFVVPATALLIVAGGLAGAGLVDERELMVGGVVGCLLGDAASYLLGRVLGPRAETLWPFRTRPHLLARGEAFFKKHGWWGVFMGRFFGPMRAVVPTCAGILGMPVELFAGVSLASAVMFVPLMLAPGAILGAGIEGAAHGGLQANILFIVLVGLLLLVAVAWLYRFRRSNRADIDE